MHKKMLFLLFVFSLFLTSCNNYKMSAFEVMSKLGTDNGYIYTNDADISSVNYISAEDLGFLYYGESTPPPELNNTQSYCIYISRDIEPREIHVFKAKYQSDVDTLKRMLKSRADLLSKPQINPNSSLFITETGIDCRVFSKGRFVFLLAGNFKQTEEDLERLF